MTYRPVPIALLIAMTLLTAGCGGPPTEENNRKARTEVMSSAVPVVFDAKQINTIMAAEQSGNAAAAFGGRVFLVSGLAKEKRFEELATKTETQRTLQLVVENPDYVSVEVTCHFAAVDETKVREVNPGIRVGVRGKFRSAGQSEITIEGCQLEN